MKKKLFGKHLDFYEAIATLVGTTIGAGIFGIPFVVAKSGILSGIICLAVLSFVVLMINLYVGEICLRTKKVHQLAGFAELYLGKNGKAIMALITVFSIVGALIAYIIGEGQVLSAIFGGSSFLFSMLFFVIASFLLYFDLKAIEKAELYLSFFMIFVIMVIIAISFGHINMENLSNLSLGNIFLPYGVILFALVGASAIPGMEKEMQYNKQKLKKAIIIGTLIPFVVYFLFMIAVVGVTGLATTEIATIGLGQKIGEYMILLGNIFPVFSMSTSFLALGLALKWMLHYDYKWHHSIAWFATCITPLLLFFAGAKSFINVIGITGAVAGGLEGIMIIIIAKKAKEKCEQAPLYSIPIPLLLQIILIILFVLGIVYQFVKF